MNTINQALQLNERISALETSIRTGVIPSIEETKELVRGMNANLGKMNDNIGLIAETLENINTTLGNLNSTLDEIKHSLQGMNSNN